MTAIPRKIEITARVFFTTMAALSVGGTVLLTVRGIMGDEFEFGTMLLLLSSSMIMLQEAWSRRFEPLAIAAASPQHERDERRRMLAAKAKAIAGGSAMVAGIVLFILTEVFSWAAEAFEAIGAVQSVQATVGVMAFCYFIGRFMVASVLNRRE